MLYDAFGCLHAPRLVLEEHGVWILVLLAGISLALWKSFLVSLIFLSLHLYHCGLHKRDSAKFRQSLSRALESDTGESVVWLNVVLNALWTEYRPLAERILADSIQQRLSASAPDIVKCVDVTKATVPDAGLVLSDAHAHRRPDGQLGIKMGAFVAGDIAVRVRLFVKGAFMPMYASVSINEVYAKVRGRIKLRSGMPGVEEVGVTLEEVPVVRVRVTINEVLTTRMVPVLETWLDSVIGLAIAKRLVDPDELTIDTLRPLPVLPVHNIASIVSPSLVEDMDAGREAARLWEAAGANWYMFPVPCERGQMFWETLARDDLFELQAYTQGTVGWATRLLKGDHKHRNGKLHKWRIIARKEPCYEVGSADSQTAAVSMFEALVRDVSGRVEALNADVVTERLPLLLWSVRFKAPPGTSSSATLDADHTLTTSAAK